MYIEGRKKRWQIYNKVRGLAESFLAMVDPKGVSGETGLDCLLQTPGIVLNKSFRHPLPLYILLLPFLVYLVSAFLTFIVVEEDAFIYFRIAQNMADGYGIVFNRGGEHIESGSGLTWQLLLAVIAMLPVHLVIATKFLGVVFACLALWKLLKLSDRFIDDSQFVIFPALLLAGSTPFYYWSHRGLETPLFVFALLWLLDALTDKQKIQRWYLPAIFVFCSRPEGFLIVAAILPWLWMERKSIPGFWKTVSIFVLLCAMVFAWRLWYFHDLLPHAFYQKIGGDNARSLNDLWRYSAWNGLPLLLLCSIPAIFLKQQWKREYIPLLLLIAVTGFWGVIGADWKSFNRQLSSWLPFVFLFFMIFISRGSEKLWIKNTLIVVLALYATYLFRFSPYTRSNGEIMKAPNNGCLELLKKDPAAYVKNVFSATLDPEGYFTQEEPTLAGDHIGFNRNATVGRFIQQNYPEGVTIIFDQMGQETWYAGADKKFIDNTGLTDKMIGYYTFHEKTRQSFIFRFYELFIVSIKSALWPDEKFYYSKEEIVDRLFAENPALVLIREKYMESQPNTILSMMVNDKRFKNYHRTFRINKRDFIFERNDLPSIINPIVPPGALVEFDYKASI